MELSDRLAACLAASSVGELIGGHQARVFEVIYGDGRRGVAKVVDASLVDAETVARRVQVVAGLADLDPRVCRPIPIDGRLLARITVDDFIGLVTCYEFADGAAMDPSSVADARRMGQELLRLHDSMSRLPATELPLVAALGITDPDSIGPGQLLHGDFNAANLHQLNGSIKIFDFDDCGYGPRAFDVANALYMVLFDASVSPTNAPYEPFKEAFISGYTDDAAFALDVEVLTELIDRRVSALASWLDDLSNAPTGIRTASPEWHGVLRCFVTDYNSAN